MFLLLTGPGLQIGTVSAWAVPPSPSTTSIPASQNASSEDLNGRDGEVKILIEQIEPSAGSARRSDPAADPLLRLSLRVHVRNGTTGTVTVRSKDFSLTADGVPAGRGTFSTGPELTETELQPGDEMAGWLWFTDIDCSDGEPLLALTWSSNGLSTLISVNEEIRRLTDLKAELRGPDNCLGVLYPSGNLNVPSSWVLQDAFVDLHRQGVRRVVILPKTNSPVQISDETLRWLSGWKQTGPAIVHAGPDQTPLDRRFLELHLGDFDRTPARRLPGSSEGVDVHEDNHEAVRAALSTVYLYVSVDQVFKDIRNDDAGVRRAALAACADRLDRTRQREYLQLLKSAVPERQVEMLAPMHLMTQPEVLPALREMCLSEDAQVSAAACNAITRTGDPEAAEVVAELWLLSASQPGLRQRLIGSALKSRDYRWADLLAKHATDLLHEHAESAPFSGGQAAPAEPVQRQHESADDQHAAAGDPQQKPRVIGVGEAPPPAKPAEEPADVPQSVQGAMASSLTGGSPTESKDLAASLREILPFLRQHKHTAAMEACRGVLLDIPDPAIQDIVVDFLLHWRDEIDGDVVSRYLEQRLARDRVTETCRNAAFQYPDPRWTPHLLRDFHAARSQSASQRKSLAAALRCATGEQLDELLMQYSELDLHSQGMILSHLAAVEYPGWREIARDSLKLHSIRLREAMDVLQQDSSDESIRILNGHLLDLMNSDVDWKERPADQVRTQIQPLISQISLFSHPESHRVLNRCLRHPDEAIRNHAAQAIMSSSRRSPAWAGLMEVVELRKAEKYADAKLKCDECIQSDPFLSDAYLFRASLLLRDDRLDDAMQDLRTADRLCPEELSTQSTIALVMVRQGQVPEGLRLADETLLLDPDEESSLYNTACVYGRASESAGISEEQKATYVDEALRLLDRSVEAGFSDLLHLQRDPDLECLHQHAGWSLVLEKLEKNQKQSDADQPEP